MKVPLFNEADPKKGRLAMGPTPWPESTGHGQTPLALFTDAHLSTNAEWAVFTVVASSRDRLWTARRVGREAKVSDHEADEALRRFSAAGIVERVDDAGHPRRYRWRPAMAYLDGGTERQDDAIPCAGCRSTPMDHTSSKRLVSRSSSAPCRAWCAGATPTGPATATDNGAGLADERGGPSSTNRATRPQPACPIPFDPLRAATGIRNPPGCARGHPGAR